MRWHILSLTAFLAAVGAGLQARAQVDPNQPQQPNLGQQLRDNMNNAGVTPQDLIQQARDQMQQNGGQFDGQAFIQNLQQQGVINQGMIDQVNQARNQLQQRNQQRQMSSLQQLLNSPDDEWAVLGAKIQRVMDLNSDLNQASVNLGQRGFAGGAGGQNALGGQSAAQGPVAKAFAELRTILQDPNSADADIAVKLTAYRQARAHEQVDLAGARQDLLTLVTLRQEAILLGMDILD